MKLKRSSPSPKKKVYKCSFPNREIRKGGKGKSEGKAGKGMRDGGRPGGGGGEKKKRPERNEPVGKKEGDQFALKAEPAIGETKQECEQRCKLSKFGGTMPAERK